MESGRRPSTGVDVTALIEAPTAAAPQRRSWKRPGGALAAGGACVALAGVSLLLPWGPTYDPWAWIVFGRELAGPLRFSTIAHTGWKPLPVLFTAPFGLWGDAAPSGSVTVRRLYDGGAPL